MTSSAARPPAEPAANTTKPGIMAATKTAAIMKEVSTVITTAAEQIPLHDDLHGVDDQHHAGGKAERRARVAADGGERPVEQLADAERPERDDARSDRWRCAVAPAAGSGRCRVVGRWLRG